VESNNHGHEHKLGAGEVLSSEGAGCPGGQQVAMSQQRVPTAKKDHFMVPEIMKKCMASRLNWVILPLYSALVRPQPHSWKAVYHSGIPRSRKTRIS